MYILHIIIGDSMITFDDINEIEYEYLQINNLIDILNMLLQEEDYSLSNRNRIHSLNNVITDKRCKFKKDFDEFLTNSIKSIQ